MGDMHEVNPHLNASGFLVEVHYFRKILLY
jgi:hypothetical protein